MKRAFDVYNTHGGTVATIWMDTDLVKDENIVDQNTLTLRPIKNGGTFTLVPLDDPRILVLQNLRHVYLTIAKKPCQSFSQQISRVDSLIEAVRKTFEDVELLEVKSAEDMDMVINGEKDDKELTTIKISVLGDLSKEILEQDTELLKKWKKEIEDESASPKF